MKIAISVKIDVEGGPIDEFVVNNLTQIGFVVEPNADGDTHLSYDGEISSNDLAYGASMMRSLKRN